MTVNTPRWNQNETDFIRDALASLASQDLSQRERAHYVWNDFHNERQTNLMLNWRSKGSVYHAVRRIEREETARMAREGAETNRVEADGFAVPA